MNNVPAAGGNEQFCRGFVNRFIVCPNVHYCMANVSKSSKHAWYPNFRAEDFL